MGKCQQKLHMVNTVLTTSDIHKISNSANPCFFCVRPWSKVPQCSLITAKTNGNCKKCIEIYKNLPGIIEDFSRVNEIKHLQPKPPTKLGLVPKEVKSKSNVALRA